VTTVTHTLVDEIAGPLRNAYVEVSLLAPTVDDPAYILSGGYQIIGRKIAQTNTNGNWTLDLVPNSSITPANTVYRVIHSPKGDSARTTAYFKVPVAGATPTTHTLLSLLTNPPGNLGGGVVSGTIDILDEGILTTTANSLNFVGIGVTVTDMGGGVSRITVTGGGGATPTSGSLEIKLNNSTAVAAASKVDFSSQFGVAESPSGEANVTIAGISSAIVSGLGTAAAANTTAFDAAGAAAAAQAASQPIDSDLTTIGNISPTNDDIIQRKAGVWTNRSIAQLIIDLGSNFQSLAATPYQPLDSDLTAIALLSTTAYGRAFLALADATAGRSALALGTAATSSATDFQPVDSDLTAIALLSTTSFGRSLLTLNDAAALRAAAGVGTASLLDKNTVSVTPIGVRTTNYNAAAGDFIPADVSGGGFTVTLPDSPIDGARIGIKLIAASIAATPAILSVVTSGSNTFNTTGGSTSVTMTLLNQGLDLQFRASTGIWYTSSNFPITSLDTRYLLTPTEIKTTDYNAVGGDLIPVDLSGGSVTITLPFAPIDRTLISAKLLTLFSGATPNLLTIVCSGTNTFNRSGSSTFTMSTQNQRVDLQYQASTGTWHSASALSLGALDTRYLTMGLDKVLTVGQSTLSRPATAGSSQTMATGQLRLTYFTSTKTETVTQCRVNTHTTAAGATPTLVRFGLYSVAGNGDLTLIASTPNDTTLFAVANTSYTRAFSVPVGVSIGMSYAFGILVVTGAAAPTVRGLASITEATEYGQAPRMFGQMTGQTNLPTPIASGSITNSGGGGIYSVILP